MTTYIKKSEPAREEDDKQVRDLVGEILAKVKKEGDSALYYYEKKFDDYEPENIRVSKDEMAAAKGKLPLEVIEELDFAISQVTKFAEAQRGCLSDLELDILPGLTMGHRVLPVESCACYVPAGRYPCLTSAVMSVIPAKVAGVSRIVVACPPGRDKAINPGILYTLDQMGVKEIYCMGGAQAIGAFAFGTETTKPVNLIVGPGNQWVQEAKRQVFGTCGLDFLAGPSEVMVIADASARADFIAADLLAQCEHDPNARGSFVTTSRTLAEAVVLEVEKQLKVLKTEDVARKSWETKGEVVLFDTLEECAAYANSYAPEHLEVHTKVPADLLNHLT